MKHTAACSCKQLTLSFEGERPASSICHCIECRKRTGSIFATQIRLNKANVTTLGESTTWQRTGDGGMCVTFHFCPTCGSTVFWTLDGMEDAIIVALGAFEDASDFPAPTFSVYEDRMPPWVHLPTSIVTHMG